MIDLGLPDWVYPVCFAVVYVVFCTILIVAIVMNSSRISRDEDRYSDDPNDHRYN
jgi:hypothetical protein